MTYHKSKAFLFIFLFATLMIVGVYGLMTALVTTAVAAPTADSCFISINNSGTTDYSSTDASALQTAVSNASPNDLIKIAGTCAGVQTISGETQTVYISKSLTLQGGYTSTNWLTTPDPDTNPTVLDAQNNGRVVYIPSESNVTLDGLIMQRGSAADGGGIYNSSVLTVTNSRLISNTATNNGGGLYAVPDNGRTVISNTHFYSNTGGFYGGGLHACHPITIVNSQINQNVTGDYGAGAAFEDTLLWIDNTDIVSNTNLASDGGGLNLEGSQGILQSSRVLSNTALDSSGGGVYVSYGSTLDISDSEIAYNWTAGDGGGITVDGGGQFTMDNSYVHHNDAPFYDGGGLAIYPSGVVTVTRSIIAFNGAGDEGGGVFINSAPNHFINNTISHNQADYGGGVFISKASVQFINNTMSHNQADYGGGFYAQAVNEGGGLGNSLINLIQSTVLSNTALFSGGGIYLEDAVNGNAQIARATLQNSVIAGNDNGDCALKNGWEEVDAAPGYNLDSDGSCVIDGVDNNMTSADPGLGPLAFHGGDTPTHLLQASSPALEAIPLANCILSSDQRGVARPQGPNCDMGAVEMQTFSLTTVIDGSGTGSISGTGINCGADCTENYLEWTTVTLTTAADTGSVFSGWSGACTNSTGDCVVTMDQAQSVTATFSLVEYKIYLPLVIKP